MFWIELFILFFLGLIFGSFLNVMVYRIHKDEDWIFSRSKCVHCNTKLELLDLIPLFSYIFLKGRCRYCKKSISIFYVFGELTLALLWTMLPLLGYGLDNIITYILMAIIFASLGIFMSDFSYREIPLIFLLILGLFGLIYNIIVGQFDFLGMLIGLTFVSLFFGLPFLITKGRGMGLGDLFLGFVLVMTLGFYKTIFTITMAYVVAAALYLTLLVFRKIDKKYQIPIGSFIIFSFLIVLFFGSVIIDWYYSLIFY
ncbi:MAG: prepilin peptidase [Candidatus Dojkabacteria bacterium]|nr:prepilin peptidase [Candidatus Dojkabacteria bacterium]